MRPHIYCALLLCFFHCAVRMAAGECIVNVGSGLRLLSYNASFATTPPNDPLDDPTDVYVIDDDDRATQIADKIKADDPDLFVLNEVFDNDIKDKFVELFKSTYPNFVKMLDDEWTSVIEDGGLMLFSKYPFSPIPANGDDAPDYAGVEDEGSADEFVDGEEVSDHTSHIIFEDLAGDDKWAEKGAGLVKVINLCDNNLPVWVAYTHLQTQYKEDADIDQYQQVWNRQRNLRAIKWMIRDVMSASELNSERLFVLGDLNVNGSPGTNSSESHKEAADEDDEITYNSEDYLRHNEWQHTFNWLAPFSDDPSDDMNRQFYSRGSAADQDATYNRDTDTGSLLIDAWGFETSADDFGQTNFGSTTGGDWRAMNRDQGERVDYVLHNKPVKDAGKRDQSLCMQYIKRGLNYISTSAKGGVLSDHIPVIADLNLPAPRCSPTEIGGNGPKANAALVVPFDPADVNNVFHVYDGREPFPKYCHGKIESDKCEPTLQGALTRFSHPGSMQWYILNHKGSYEIKVSGGSDAAGFPSYAVYQSKDLSTELDPWAGQCKFDGERREWKCKWHLTDPPYYVRVFPSKKKDAKSPKRDNPPNLPYKIVFRRFTCKSQEDACFLAAHVESSGLWPKGQLCPECETDKNTMWFEFRTEGAAPDPDITFVWKNFLPVFNAGDDPVGGYLVDGKTLELVSLNWAAKYQGFNDGGEEPHTFRRATPPVNSLSGETVGGVDGVLPKKYYLKLLRADQTPEDPVRYGVKFETRVSFFTTLTYFEPLSMTAIIEDTWSGLDDIWMSMHGDVCHPSSTDCYRIGDFDGGHNKPVTTYSLFRKFTSNIFPYAYEDVDDNEGFRLDVGDWYEANRVISPLGWSGSGGPGTNGSWTGEQDDSDSTPIEYYQDPKDDTDYHYNFAYKRVKEKPSCTGKQDSSGNPCPFSTSCQHGHCCPDGVGCGY